MPKKLNLLEQCLKELEAQIKGLKADRLAGSPHKVKMANAIGSLARAIINVEAELRQQEKHKQKIFDDMSDDELDDLLCEHFIGLSQERLEKFQEALDSHLHKRGILG